MKKRKLITIVTVVIAMLIAISGIIIINNNKLNGNREKIEIAAKNAIAKNDKNILQKDKLIEELNKVIEEKYNVTTIDNGYMILLNESGKMYTVAENGQTNTVKWTTLEGQNKVVDENGKEYQIGDYIDYDPKIPNQSGKLVDFVKPIWELISDVTDLYSNNGTKITLKITGTDTYYASDALQECLNKGGLILTDVQDKIRLYIDGNQITEGVSVKISGGNALTETRTANEETKTVQYGIEYIIEIENFPRLANQVKVVLPQGTLTDTSKNVNEETEFIVYSCLKPTYMETEPTSKFLGIPNIQRNQIEKIVFVDSKDLVKGEELYNVAAQEDNSIIAGYVDDNQNGKYEVYIGSDKKIYANINSSYLFANTAIIGFEGLERLYTENVSNMQYMFYNCNKLSSLDLGTNFNTMNALDMSYMFAECTNISDLKLQNKFNTEKVSNMQYMFNNCTNLRTLELPEKFNTSKVTDMQYMFNNLSALNSINLGENFDTSKVKNMTYMFNNCNVLTQLDLKDKFNTIEVTDMSYMFNDCISLKSLNLGSKFNTKEVTNMENMFNSCRRLENLELGQYFNTNKVTNMRNMFNNCLKLRILDLGPAFTKIAYSNENMFNNCGETGTIIYCGEAIYLDVNKFRLNPDTSREIEYTIGNINCKYKIIWSKVSSRYTEEKKLEVVIQAIGDNVKYLPNSTILTVDNIHIYIDGVLADDGINVSKQLSAPREIEGGVQYTVTLSDFEQSARQKNLPFKEWSGNVSIKIDRRMAFDEYQVDGNYGNGNLIDEVKDEQNITSNMDGTMFYDYIKPEITYKYLNTDINYEQEKLTITMDVIDKYIDNSKNNLTLADFTLKVYNYDETGKGFWEEIDIKDTEKNSIESEEIDYGKRYTLVIGNFIQELEKKYKNHSGYITLTIGKDKVADLSGNKNNAQTITIGINEPDDSQGEAVIVDVVKPTWTIDSDNIQIFNKDLDNTLTENYVIVDIMGKDKYYSNDTLTKEKIHVLSDGVDITNDVSVELIKTVEEQEIGIPLYELRDGENVQYGIKYHVKISGFEQAEKLLRREYLEWSGYIELKIEPGTIQDKSQNTNIEETLYIGMVDFIKPQIEKVELTEEENLKDLQNKTKTIKFNAIDKYLDTTVQDLGAKAESIGVYVDGIRADEIQKNLTYTDIVKVIENNKYTTKYTVREYTLTLSGFEIKRTVNNRERQFIDYSGYVTLNIPEDFIRDVTGNKNKETELIAGDVDYIKPTITYEHSASDIDHSNRKYTMTIDITDRYFNQNTNFVLSNIKSITVDGTEIKQLASKGLVTIELKEKEIIKNIINNEEIIIGKRYELILSNLQQKPNDGIDYSGVITVAITQNTIFDLNNNGNNGTSITSGIDLPGGTEEDQEIVDIVQPIWKRERLTVDTEIGIANLTVKGIDKYQITESIQKAIDNKRLRVIIDDIDRTTDEKIKVSLISSQKAESGKEIVSQIRIEGFENDIENVFLYLPSGTLTDEFGNMNTATMFALLSCLSVAEDSNGVAESLPTSPFLGGKIQRQDIEKIVFEKDIKNINKSTSWLVSTSDSMQSEGDMWNGEEVIWDGQGQIFAWYNETTAPYTVHIGSDVEINTNPNSSYLFANIGNSAKCKSNVGIENIELLNTNNALNMNYMFYNFGYTNVTSLELGNRFYTKNSKSMKGMFEGCGYNSLTTFNLGDNFETDKVEDMQAMFKNFAKSLAKLDLKDKFHVTNVKNMQEMFYSCGTMNMTEIDLGQYFTRIGTENTDFATNLGKENESIVLIPESIYSSLHYFKTNSTSETTINTNAMLNPIYRPEWIRTQSLYDNDEKPTKIILEIEGKTNAEIYNSEVTNSLQQKDLKVYVDGDLAEEIETILEPLGDKNKYRITIQGFENSVRKSGKKFLEWSGNVTIQLAEKTLIDQLGNQNIEQIELKDTGWKRIEIGDTEVKNKNEAGSMFIDIINPEIQYKYSKNEEYSNPDINYEAKNLTVVFDVIDKYFKSSKLIEGENLENINKKIGIKVDGIDITEQLIVNLTSEDIENGKRYKMVLSNFELENILPGEEYKNYSGPVQLIFPQGLIEDFSGNTNTNTTITIDYDDGDDTDNPIIVDVINPIWSYDDSSIDRKGNFVTIKIKGSDKYLAETTLDLKYITVLIDGQPVTIDKTMNNLVSLDETNTTQVMYEIILSNFYDNCGFTQIKIEKGTLRDSSNNVNTETIIDVGNVNWTEEGDDSNNRIYTAFSNSIVDFIAPSIKYKYSEIENYKNPSIDYQKKELTLVFDVIEKYFCINNLIEGQELTNEEKVIRIKVAGVDITEQLKTSLTSVDITNGKRYTLTLSNFELEDILPGEEYKNYSGPVQLIFDEALVHDTSGNKNLQTTITIDYDDGDDNDNPVIVDVVDPIWRYEGSSIDRINEKVFLEIKGTDKYLTEATLDESDIKVIIDGKENSTVQKLVYKTEPATNELTNYVKYNVELSNFGKNSGVTEIEIAGDTIKDSSGNGNIVTKINVGNKGWIESEDSIDKPIYTAFREGIVDFIKPEWTYVTSSIDRTKNEVEIQIKGSDKHYLLDTLSKNVNGITQYDTNNIKVYVNDVEITTITKKIEKMSTNATSVIYKLTLGNFGEYDGKVKISFDEGTIRDSSGNKNIETFINVGNPEWKDDEAFADSIVDFVKPRITYDFLENENPIINYDNKSVTIKFKALDTNYKKTALLGENIAIYVDRIENKVNTWSSIGKNISRKVTSVPLYDEENKQIGAEYTVVLSNFEVEMIQGESFTRYSGKFKITIPKETITDTSGNINEPYDIVICDKKKTDSIDEATLIDFIDPKVYCFDDVVNYDYNALTATISFETSDRYFNSDTTKTDESGNRTGVIERNEIRIYDDYNNDVTESLNWTISNPELTAGGGFKYYITISDYVDEFMFTFVIQKGAITDNNGRINQETRLQYIVDDVKPRWKYISCDTSALDNGTYKMILNVKGEDRYLDISKSSLVSSDLTLYKDGVLVDSGINISVTEVEKVAQVPRSISYQITITGIKEIGTYSLVYREGVLIDVEENKSMQTTMTFSRSQISSSKFAQVTYFVDNNKTFVNELINIDSTGTNSAGNFTPSSLGELYEEGKNNYFAEAFEYNDGIQKAKSFLGWALADEEGNYIYYEDSSCTKVSKVETNYIKTYSLYEEIPTEPDQKIYLKAVWQNANVIFVSEKSGNDASDGLSPNTAVKTLESAFTKLTNGTTTNRLVVIMDNVTWNGTNTFNTKQATITSLYAGINYQETKDAKLTINSNVSLGNDIIFDNIKIDSASTNVNDGNANLADGQYSNLLICNYHNLIIGRKVNSSKGKYTFGAIIGGNYANEINTGAIGEYKLIIETGVYNNIIVRNSITLGNETTTEKFVTANAQIGSKKDGTKGQNDKLTIKGYLMLGQNEKNYYSNKAVKDSSQGYLETFANIELHSGTFTGDNMYKKNSEFASIYIRPIDTNTSDGIINFKMYGGLINGNVYAGARTIQSNTNGVYTNMYFYGGKVIATNAPKANGAGTGGIFGQGANQQFFGGSQIVLSGIFEIEGNVYGGSNATNLAQGNGTANTKISISGSSVKVKNGAIYGGSNGIQNQNDTVTGYINGSTNISVGSVNTNIYGGGYNCAVSNSTNVSIGGRVNGEIYGGGYQSYVGENTNITVAGIANGNVYGGGTSTNIAKAGVGKLNGSTWTSGNTNIKFTTGTFATTQNNVYKIYGGNRNSNMDENTLENTNIIIGEIGAVTKPMIYGEIYGGGINDKINSSKIVINTNMTTAENSKVFGKLNIYGGSDSESECIQTNIEIKGGIIENIYGGGKLKGNVDTTNIIVSSGTIGDIYGGGKENNNINKSNIKLIGGRVTNVFGSGDNNTVNETNIEVTGSAVSNLYGGGKNTIGTEKIAQKTNITLTAGNVTNMFGAGLNEGANQTNVKISGGTINSVYGGANNSGTVENSKINITAGTAINVYGGNLSGGIVQNTNVNIQNTALISNNLYAGGKNSNVGSENNPGTTNLNITGGIIRTNVNGGSDLGIVYGNTNVNIGSKVATISEKEILSGNIEIYGDIFGAGSSEYAKYKESYDNAEISEYNFDKTKSVIGNTNININGQNSILFTNSIYGVGNASTYTGISTVTIDDFGEMNNTKELQSIQRTNNLNIGNSWIELDGKIDVLSASTRSSYSLNRIDSLTVYNNAVIHVQSEFNLVKEFNSYVDKEKTTKATDKTEVVNRIYTLENLNLIFSKQEETTTEWGEVNGMAFFGLYAFNRSDTSNKKIYDIYNPDPNEANKADGTVFVEGAYIEGKKKNNHDIMVDGFYTNVFSDNGVSIKKEIITPAVETEDYYDWIIGINMVNYNVTLVGSVYERQSVANLVLNYEYLPNAKYTVSRISLNALKKGIELVDPSEIPEVANDSNVANSKFGLSMETAIDGHWTTVSSNNIYTADNGSVNQTGIEYESDSSENPPVLKFKMYNSKDITRTQNLGRVNIVLIGKTIAEETGEVQTFMIVITVDLKTNVETKDTKYVSMFKDSDDVVKDFTEDSKVELTYHLFYNIETSIYDSSDKRAIVSTMKLPAGTKLTLIDDSNSNNKAYYYIIKSTEGFDSSEIDKNGVTNYIYMLENFTEMGCVENSIKYNDVKNGNDNYFHVVTNKAKNARDTGDTRSTEDTTKNYMSESFYLTIDLSNSGITTNLKSQDVHMELRNGNVIKFGQDEENKRTFNLWTDKDKESKMEFSANLLESVSNVIAFEYNNTINVKAALQGAVTDNGNVVQDTKYFDKIGGISLEIVDSEGIRIKYPQIKEFYLETQGTDGTIRYNADFNGAIRLNVTSGYSSINKNYKIHILQNNTPTGEYKLKINYFYSDDGKYVTDNNLIKGPNEFKLQFVNTYEFGIEAVQDNRNRILTFEDKKLVDLLGNENSINIDIKLLGLTPKNRLTVELYKRNKTYNNNVYANIDYTALDLAEFFEGNWQQSVNTNNAKEYELLKECNASETTYNFIGKLKATDSLNNKMPLGEYKLVFKIYFGDIYIEEVAKTFVITE